MVFVMFLIGALAVAFVAALIAFVPARSLPIVLVIAGVILFVQFFFSDKIAAFAMGAREVTPEQYPDLHGVVETVRRGSAGSWELPRRTARWSGYTAG